MSMRQPQVCTTVDGVSEAVGDAVPHSALRYQDTGRQATPMLVIRAQRSDIRLHAGQSCIIGRDPKCDIVATDMRVSWRHAVVRFARNGWIVEDADSTNGTFQGGSRVDRLPINSDCAFRLAHPAGGPLVRCSVIRPEPGAIDVPAPRTAVLSADRRDLGLANLAASRHHAEPRNSGGGRYQIRLACQENDTPTMPMRIIQHLRPARRKPAKLGPRVVAILPAHNEGETIAATVEALLHQTCRPDEIYVFTDNCTDDGATAAAAARYGVSVTCTVGNKDMKAGCLNRALTLLMPMLDDNDVVMNFDADSVPERHFVANALKWLKRGYGAVGATFHGRPGGGLLGLLQRSEFARFARHQHRKIHCDVLSGTGAAFPVWALRKIAATRPDGQVYDVAHITEDFELTLRAKALGINAVAPSDCRVTTDVMVTWKSWWTQRLRWQLGTLFALKQYGWSPSTREMIVRQALIYLVMLATPLTLIYLVWSFLLFGVQGINPLNAPIYAIGIGIVVLEQAWQARKAGTKSIMATLGLWPDLIYSAVRQIVYIKALYRLIRRKSAGWGAGTHQ